MKIGINMLVFEKIFTSIEKILSGRLRIAVKWVFEKQVIKKHSL